MAKAEAECLADRPANENACGAQNAAKSWMSSTWLASLDEDAIRLAVIAHVRHEETDYDALLGRGMDRYEARHHVQWRIEQVLTTWKTCKLQS